MLDMQTAWELRQLETLPAVLDLCYPSGDVARFCEGGGLVPTAAWYAIATDFAQSGMPPFIALVRHVVPCRTQPEALFVLRRLQYIPGLLDWSILSRLPSEPTDAPTWWQVHTRDTTPFLWDHALPRTRKRPKSITQH